ncbi:MAG TPA: efflux RND transporter periplasmic adaptor subunit, partial [Thermodesulfobacteriota bacterium]|nr:efflux RND transporter periplasmic adaptor subunit [Thermodesulfobacteriota bacterium]
EADILRVKKGMSVYFMTLGNLEDKREGAVRLIEPSPEVVNDVVLYHALIDVDNRDRSLMNGMTTQVFFVIGRASGVPIIPVAALTERAADKDNEKGQAYLVRTSGAEGEKQLLIHVGLRDRNYAEITDGLSEGENIVITESGAGNAVAPKEKGNRRMGPPPML